MSFPITILLMIVAAVIGGTIHFIFPSNQDKVLKTSVLPWWKCVVQGFGATILVPLFLEFAQSKLLDKMTLGWCINPESLKDYLIYFSYCMVAAIAGFAFINSIISKVITEEELKVEKAMRMQAEKSNKKRAMNDQLIQKQEIQTINNEIVSKGKSNFSIVQLENMLPPIAVIDDPQKGRFGGRTEKSGLKIIAEVTESVLPGYFSVELGLVSTDPEKSSLTDAYFFLHDSFYPSVRKLTSEELAKGEKISLLSYGAFTVGVITDNGDTLLEYDLAANKKFPEEFRAR